MRLMGGMAVPRCSRKGLGCRGSRDEAQAAARSSLALLSTSQSRGDVGNAVSARSVTGVQSAPACPAAARCR